MSAVNPQQWNALAGDYPFLRHEFLTALHDSGCATPQTGWRPVYLGLWRQQCLVGALPLYVKAHSRGEFVFDQPWAEAFARHNLPYYPKLLGAVPFMPVTGPRLLAHSDEARRCLAQGAVALALQLKVSSLHILFPDATDRQILQEMGFMLRESIQFHWHNAGYADFDAFLAALNHDKRKKIRQERRRAQAAGIHFEAIPGTAIQPHQLEFFHQCYCNTYEQHWSDPYLNLDFFQRLVATLPQHLVWIFAMRGAAPVACALNVLGSGVLYGRYWGTTEFVSGLHFETCYAQAIEYCIAQGIQTFEGGAQGAHKLARGLLPTATWSAHWVANPNFAEAIARFLQEERHGVEQYLETLTQHTPFKHTPES